MERERDREGRNKKKTKRTERKKKLKGTEKDQMERRAVKTEGIDRAARDFRKRRGTRWNVEGPDGMEDLMERIEGPDGTEGHKM